MIEEEKINKVYELVEMMSSEQRDILLREWHDYGRDCEKERCQRENNLSI